MALEEEENMSELNNKVSEFQSFGSLKGGESSKEVNIEIWSHNELVAWYQDNRLRRLIKTRTDWSRQLTDQDIERDVGVIYCVKRFRVKHENVVKTAVCTYRQYQKEIDQPKQISKLDKPFPLRKAAAEYDLLYKTLSGRILRAWKIHKAHAEVQMLTQEQETVMIFQPCWTKTNEMK